MHAVFVSDAEDEALDSYESRVNIFSEEAIILILQKKIGDIEKCKINLPYI